MARGKPTPGRKKEQVKAMLYLNPDATNAEISKVTKLPNSTIHYIKRDVMATDEFEKVRQLKKEEFIQEAWEVVKKALLAADKKIELLLKDPESLAKANIRDLAVALGTIYDKQALASGEPTTIIERQEPTPELVAELRVKLSQLRQLTGG